MIDLGAPAPDLAMEGATFHAWRNGRWALLVAAKAMSPTCSTEVAELVRLAPEFARRDVGVAMLLCDPVTEVARWFDDLSEIDGVAPFWPLMIDEKLETAAAYGLVDRAGTGVQRALILVAPDGSVALTQVYPVTNGRNFTEVLRAIDAAQLTASARVATPADWEPGRPVMLPPSLSQADAEARYPQGVDVRRPYLRYVTLTAA